MANSPPQLLAYIVGGQASFPNEFPHQVHLDYDGQFHCGGTILNTFFILTAAHCLLNSKYKVEPNASRFQIVAGDHNLIVDEGTEQHRNVEYILLHESYNKRSPFADDMALLVLKTPLDFNSQVNNIALPRTGIKGEMFEGTLTVTGWGKTSYKGSSSHGRTSTVLNKVTIPIIPYSQCREIYRNTKAKISDSMICAGSSGRDICSGDSGGPATCKSRITNETVLCGIVSFGVACGDTEHPGVYSDVSYYKDWIESTIDQISIAKTEEKCKTSEFYCAKDNSCICRTHVCDGKPDCSTGEDELACLDITRSQKPNTFRCNNGKFINSAYACDAENDCGDNSDEIKCGEIEMICESYEFRCQSDGRCITKRWHCDKIEDCDDASDEELPFCESIYNLDAISKNQLDLELFMRELSNKPRQSGNSSCLQWNTSILMANGNERPVQELEVGDVILDHQLKPTKVLGISSEFLLGEKFYGFDNKTFFFTNTHMFVGPKLEANSSDFSIYAQNTQQLLTQNPLVEFLDVQKMFNKMSLYKWDQNTSSVEPKSIQVFEDPKTYPEDTKVFFLQVDSPSGTYFANGYVCRHEIPPFEKWPNTMTVIFTVFSDPKLLFLQSIRYTLQSLHIIQKVTEELEFVVQDTLMSVSHHNLKSDEPILELKKEQVDEVLGQMFNNPSFSAFGMGVYGRVGKLLAILLDDSVTKIRNDNIRGLQDVLVETMLKNILSSATEHFTISA